MSADCLFCKIAAGEIPSHKVFEDEKTLAFMDINPVHPGHCLVIPKEHGPNLFEISPDAVAAAARTAQLVGKAVNEALAPDGMNLVQCNGRAAAQSIMHLHVHIMPRYEGDNLPLNWELKPGDHGEIAAIAARIREAVGG